MIKTKSVINRERLKEHLAKNPGIKAAGLAELFGCTIPAMVTVLNQIRAEPQRIGKSNQFGWSLRDEPLATRR